MDQQRKSGTFGIVALVGAVGIASVATYKLVLTDARKPARAQATRVDDEAHEPAPATVHVPDPPVVARVSTPAEVRVVPEVAPEPATDEREREETPPPTEAERGAYAQAVFDAEAMDANWAQVTRNDLTAKLGTIKTPGAAIKDISCRSTLCRVGLRYESHDKGEAYLKAMIRANVFQGTGMATRGEPNAKGEQDVTLYFAREGSPLPDVSSE